LSGKWKFKHADNPFEAPQGFELPGFDVSDWSDIQVPGHWQLQGWRKPHYSNVNFIFPVDPPNISLNQNQTGSYITKFTVPERFSTHSHQLRLRFEGVDSAFHVFLNGQQIGYSEGARNPSEFDISDFVIEQENVLAVRVYQFCNGSYLEDQDQWRMSGIFRDVLLVAFPKNQHVRDFHIQTELDDDYKDARLSVKVKAHGEGLIQLKLFDGSRVAASAEQESTAPSKACVTRFNLPISRPRLWSADSPYLYKLVITFGGRCIMHEVGFRRIEIKNGIFLVNGQRIVFRGVNRHEHRKTLLHLSQS
jgi:beta-galactosidase